MHIPQTHILANKKGSFFYWSEQPYTKYGGWHVPLSINGQTDMVKCLEEIHCGEPLTETIEYGKSIVNKRHQITESWYLDKEHNALAYHLSAPRKLTVMLDVRKSSDFDEWGRIYTIEHKNNYIHVRFLKKDSLGKIVYEYSVVIMGNFSSAKNCEEFVSRQYAYDAFRGGRKDWHVYSAITTHASSLCISIDTDEHKAFQQAHALYTEFHDRYHKDFRFSHVHTTHTEKQTHAIARWHAEHSLELLSSERGIYAGYPWFYQYWMRDELISMSFLIKKHDYAKALFLLKKYVTHIPEDGIYTAMPPTTGNKSIDGSGWLAVRIYDILMSVRKSNHVLRRTVEKEIECMIPNLQEIEKRISQSRIQNNLIWCKKNETWMDTDYEDDGRIGYCIEIQALHLRLLSLLYELTHDEKYQQKRVLMEHTVRQHFFDGNKLADRLTHDLTADYTSRPNIFIASYVYPELFENSVWETLIDTSIDDIWCSWGGLSSISKHDKQFTAEYTGENNKSYHRGDSWYFLNCMAAIVMHRINPLKFKHFIHAILQATIEEQMHRGVIGSVAEVSDAKKMQSYGCPAQSWSAAMLIELIDEVSHDK